MKVDTPVAQWAIRARRPSRRDFGKNGSVRFANPGGKVKTNPAAKTMATSRKGVPAEAGEGISLPNGHFEQENEAYKK